MKIHGLSFPLMFGTLLALAAPARAQTIPPAPEIADLSGPRFGLTVLSSGIRDHLNTTNKIDVAPVVTQFGWQLERQFYNRRQAGPTVVTEAVFLVGGLEQGVALPSLSWLTGIRTRHGTEFGIGPNITPVGTAMAFAAGRTIRTGVLNVPVNVAVVRSKSGIRVSALTGFSLRR